MWGAVELALMGEGQRAMQSGGPVLDQRSVQLLDLTLPGEAMAIARSVLPVPVGPHRMRLRPSVTSSGPR